jgi:PKD repeat protein
MKARLVTNVALASLMLVLALLTLSGPDIAAQRPEEHGPLDRPPSPATRVDTGLQEGKPLPGTRYPEPRVQRAPPTPSSLPPEGVDLDVTFINRQPMYKAYCVQYPGGIPTLCPGTESEQRWPAPGQVVTFTAHIVNKGTLASPAFTYRWTIDGSEVLSDSHPSLAPGEESTVTYPWTWAHTMDGERVVDDHTIGFAVDPGDLVAETYESNNSIEDRTNALGFRIAITPEMYEAYNTPWYPASFSYSAEDWLQRQIAAMNASLADSTYPATPGGATERVRINEIVVTSTAPPWDRTSDGGWFVDADYRQVSGGYDPASDVDWNLVHELSHQVGLIDLYMSGIYRTVVQVLDRDGGPANMDFSWPRPGLMGGGDIAPHTDHHLYSSHSAAGISSTKGYRRGYYGEYQFDIPAQNELFVMDNQGHPAAGVQVALYQRTGPPVWPGDLTIDNTPEISGTTGPDGRLLLTNRPVGAGVTTQTGHTLHDNPFGVIDVVGRQNIFLVKLAKGDHQEFAWTHITAFNLAYWMGDTVNHVLTFPSHVPPDDAPAAPAEASVRVTGDQATLCWEASPTPGVTGYYVYRAAAPVYDYEQVSGLVTGLCYSEAYAGTRIYAVTAVDGALRESGFSNFAWAPRLLNPWAVGATADGLRTVLDPQNGYALLRQWPDGRYMQNIGSPHYHLEASRYLAIDSQDRLVLSHPGDWYTDRHSVRVADRDANPILEFGQRGSGPGEFETPAGVAVVGQGASIEGPYPDDAHTLLLLHFDGTYAGTQGEPGTASGTSFAAGRYSQGVAIDASDTLTYPAAGNVQRVEGAVEFWLRPNWAGSDNLSHTFFEVGEGWFNRIRITKDGANNLRLMVWDSAHEYGVATNVAHWQAGEWHHVAATWQDMQLTLYVDGLQRDHRSDAHPPDSLDPVLYVGSTSHGDQQADAVLDELRVSDVARLGMGGPVPYRILVADQGNHRLQAFDELGGFVCAYGAHGTGPGQFENPAGLAVTEDGLVIVADAGNNRLQILGFDGSAFAFPRVLDAGLLQPTGVAAYGDEWIVVADTGNDRVLVLDREGNPWAEYTEPNDGYTGPFSQPRDVLADCSGAIVVADQGKQRVVTVENGLPVWASFRATPTTGTAPLAVSFADASCGNYADRLWTFGDGTTSSLDAPTHVYTRTGLYTVSLTVSGPGGSDIETKPAHIQVRGEHQIYVPLVLKDWEPGPPPCSEQLQNGGFEDDSAWILGTTVRPARYTTERIHSGERAMLLGYKPGEGDDYSYSSIRQTVTLPADADSATLDFWYYPMSDGDEGDRQDCLLLSEGGSVLELLMRTNLDADAWVHRSYDLTTYAGQTIQVYFNALNDGDGQGVTGFYLDDVSLQACTAQRGP